MKTIQAINACNHPFPTNHEPVCRVYPISEERNQAARFVANYGLQNLEGLVEVDYSLLALREILDNDIGWGTHMQELHVQPNFSGWKVIQGPKPKKRK